MRVIVPLLLVTALGLPGCANDPVYIPAPMTMEAGTADMMGMLTEAKAQLVLPIKTETASDAMKRTALSTELGVAVPYVKLGDIEIEVEWTITNLDATQRPENNPYRAKIQLNGANELYAYDPSTIVYSIGDEDAPPTPGLAGDIPIEVPAGGQVSGLFTEDQLREASIDLDQITRGNVNPFKAMLTISKNAASFQPMTTPTLDINGNLTQSPTGDPIPRAAFAAITRIDLVFKPNAHMVLDFTVRVRDLRGVMHDLLLTAVTEKPGELATFTPMQYDPMLPTAP
jgi:hypothetical protein